MSSWWISKTRQELHDAAAARKFPHVRLPHETVSEPVQAAIEARIRNAARGRAVSAGRRSVGFDTPAVTVLRDLARTDAGMRAVDASDLHGRSRLDEILDDLESRR